MSDTTGTMDDPFAQARPDSIASVRALRASAYGDPRILGAIEGRVRELAETFPQLRNETSRREAAWTLGLGQWVLQRPREAVEALRETAPASATAFLRGRAALEAGLAAQAEAAFASVQATGPDAAPLELGRIEAMIAQDHLDEAQAELSRLRTSHDAHADYHYQWGRLHERRRAETQAIESLERAAQIDPQHAGALFALALHYDRAGADDEAVESYERVRKMRPTYRNALMNLGVLHEDRGEYETAIDCYRAVLRAHPDDERARLYLKDAVASTDMFYNEDLQKQEEMRGQILESPITEFELSVRSRKCLEQMQIQTIRDLVQRTEDELLAYKNFGETSLNEIKELLAQRGLSLGMKIEERKRTWDDILRGEEIPRKEDKLLATPVSEMGLSVRARRALSRLRVFTLGELIQKSEEDLLACRNFGRTSLKEILARLGPMGLSLAKGIPGGRVPEE
ncbi:MAG: tetratricopeptide repeat protein [Planctomycetes bacterium]|nr:tetratricopeptide repeat protein [Planctomycetota bacterium]